MMVVVVEMVLALGVVKTVKLLAVAAGGGRRGW